MAFNLMRITFGIDDEGDVKSFLLARLPRQTIKCPKRGCNQLHGALSGLANFMHARPRALLGYHMLPRCGI